MDITVYLPNELGARAKAAGLNLSRLLRDAVEEELTRMETLERTAADPQVHELDLKTEDGDWYIGRITATPLSQSENLRTYLLEDEDDGYSWVVFHEAEEGEINYVNVDDLDAEAVRNYVGTDQDAYIRVCSALGIKAVVDL